jgi:hypothetical protein
LLKSIDCAEYFGAVASETTVKIATVATMSLPKDDERLEEERFARAKAIENTTVNPHSTLTITSSGVP